MSFGSSSGVFTSFRTSFGKNKTSFEHLSGEKHISRATFRMQADYATEAFFQHTKSCIGYR